MKAIGYNQAGPITAPDALIEFEAETPELGPRDLLVEVRGISINPVDVKVRAIPELGPEKGQTKIIGYDAAGVIRDVGSDVSQFNVGDEVYYAGDVTRSGTNSELHAVDERIVGKKPKSLGFAEAAGFPGSRRDVPALLYWGRKSASDRHRPSRRLQSRRQPASLHGHPMALSRSYAGTKAL